ncbi:MAG: Fe-S protein assembly co-chaperone HscB [Thiotrichaceae bacterium]
MSLTNNYFELFNLPISLKLIRTSAQCYRDLQRTIHPDKFADAPERERLLALQQAAYINTAYQTLKIPLSRAQYLLQLHDNSDNNEHDVQLDSEFLMEQIELRETLSEIRQLEVLNQFLTEVERKIQQLLATLTIDFQQADYTVARDTVKKLQFLDKLHREIMILEEQLSC